MTVTTTALAGAPALLVFEGEAEAAARQGTVLLYHGFTADKTVNLPELGRLARAGFLAVGVDAVGHGGRRFSDFEQRFPLAWDERASEAFYHVVERTAAEVPAVVDALVGRGLCHERLGIAGISMGAHIAYGAVLAERRIQAAVVIIGSPLWKRRAHSPHLQPERFAPVALLTQLAGQDSVVPPEPARRLHAELVPRYADTPERLRLVEFPDSDHMMAPADWERAVENTVGWFRQQLPTVSRQ